MNKTIYVDGMVCEHCAKSVKEALEKIDGIECANVSLGTKTVDLTLSKEVDPEKIENTVLDIGFELIK